MVAEIVSEPARITDIYKSMNAVFSSHRVVLY